MIQTNPANYLLAHEFIANGDWRVDPQLGFVYGKTGRPFRRTASRGYIQIQFCDPVDYRILRKVLAHRLIWEAVHGTLDPELTINHLNGVKNDNRLVNLEAVTQLENNRHAWATGLARPYPRVKRG